MAASSGGEQPCPQPASGGWHPGMWASEFLGTFALLFGGVFAVVLAFHPDSPLVRTVPDIGWRRLAVGLLFVGVSCAYAYTPPGRRSGAHLNPAVSLGFFLQRHLHWHDLVGYCLAQSLGAVVGVAAARLVAPGLVTAPAVGYASTRPGPGTSTWAAAGLEAAMTATVLTVIFLFVSSARTARWTPVAAWLLISVFVWQLAYFTGVSVNPARSLGPDLVANDWATFWVYVVGPLGGAAAASVLWTVASGRATLTAKLVHDARYPTTVRTMLPAMPARSQGQYPRVAVDTGWVEKAGGMVR